MTEDTRTPIERLFDDHRVMTDLTGHGNLTPVQQAARKEYAALRSRVEELEAERDEAVARFDSINWSSRNWTNAMRDLKAKAERYEAALRETASHPDDCPNLPYGCGAEFVGAARAALAAVTPPGDRECKHLDEYGTTVMALSGCILCGAPTHRERGPEMSLGINEPAGATMHHHHGPFWHTHGGIIGAGQHEHDGEVAVVFAEMFPWGEVADPCGHTQPTESEER